MKKKARGKYARKRRLRFRMETDFGLFCGGVFAAPPRFKSVSDDVVYVTLSDPVILICLAEGTPAPELLWEREGEPVQTSANLAVTNDGTELRIASVRQEDIGDFTCVAKNGQGTVRRNMKIVVAGEFSFV